MDTPFSPLLFSALALCAFCVPADAGSAREVCPTPQFIMEFRSAPFSGTELSPQTGKAFPAIADALRKHGLETQGDIGIRVLRGNAARHFCAEMQKISAPSGRLFDIPGAYILKITNEGIDIAALDDTGVFYATQTLAQMLETDGKLPSGVITDWPDIPFRGSIEGFYGKPWEHERRLSQIRFYGKYKMNAYVYGPKDDPYSGFNSNHWRDPYPGEQARQITELVEEARKNHVDFIWALHPGATIRWEDKDGDGIPDDTIAALKKFEAMYALGVRAFAVFFDDIGGEGAKAEKQAEMLNFLDREFIRKKNDVAPLLMCPTDYAGAKGSEYKKTLGEKLNKTVNIMWTGPSICSDVPADAVETVSRHWQRAPFIWWNWPVDDYCRTNLLLGRTYGLDKANKGKLAGLASNPMDKPEASKIALYGVADYAWNIDAFDSDASWKKSFAKLYPDPEIAEAMYIFAQHNSDQGPNGHGYRREESVEAQPLITRALNEYRAGALSAETRNAVREEFLKIGNAAATLSQKLPTADPALWHEIEYWVKSYAALGTIGTALLEGAPANFNAIAAARALQEDYFAAQKKRHFDETFPSDKQWATGCRVATRLLTPFTNELTAGEWKKFCVAAGHDLQNAPAVYKAMTNVPALGTLQADRSGKYVNLRRILEVVKLAPGEWIGLGLPEGVFADYIHVKLDNADAAKACKIVVSKDGETWTNFNARVSGGELQNPVDPKKEIRFFRLINASETPVEFRINQFKFDVPDNAAANTRDAMFDGDLSTFYTLTEPTTFTASKQGQGVVLICDAPETRPTAAESVRIPASPERPVRIFEIVELR